MGDRDLAYKSVFQIPISTDTPGSGDWRLWFDASAGEWKRQDASTGDAAFDDLSVADLTVTATGTFAGATIANLGTVSAATSITTSALVAPTAATFAGATIADLGTVTTGDFTALQIGSVTVDATATEINRVADVSARLVSLTGTASIGSTHEGRDLFVTGTDAATYTLPQATGSGARYRFIMGEVNTNGTVIQVNDATDEFAGTLFQTDTDTSDALISMPCLAADNFDTVTLNGTTTGGIVGDVIQFLDVATNVWHISGHTNASGTVASPLSAAVS